MGASRDSEGIQVIGIPSLPLSYPFTASLNGIKALLGTLKPVKVALETDNDRTISVDQIKVS